MGLWMKKYFWGVHNLTFREGSQKTNIETGLPKKGGGGGWARTVCRFKGGA